ncbi:glycosyl transferases group 1 family protein [Acinetobacter baumannii 99063]|uniref:Glycosyl transferases group 1 family protein n=1 Tax=Acinetobacter baumannii 99063 TaxID=1310630 RepID=A0A009SIY4_ACIBA|nr:glycosyltransferase, group 1 family protein [Acinetobacter baumannii Naval-82]EXC52952.1 glycosyl transferases group 1 family protein [Acinetobacter baumannii 99063]
MTQNDKEQFDKFHSNVIVIPNFSPFPIISSPQNNTKQIVTIGRLTDQKNYIHLLQAWEKIYQSIPDWQLNIYGEGEHKEMLQNYISKRFLKNVSLKGSTSNVKEVYERSSFFVMSSKYEGLPMVLIEAQSFGLPIVSYNCPYGPSDVIQENQNGLLVEDQNIDKLAEAILKLASSPNLLDRFSKESLLNAKKYQPEQILKIWNEKILQG